MIQDDAPAFERALLELAEVYDRKPVTTPALKIWFSSLREHPLTRVTSVLDDWVKTKVKFPAVSEILAQCNTKLSDEIEERALKDKGEFARGMNRIATPPTKFGRDCMSKVREVLARGKPDPKKWARDIIDRHLRGESLMLAEQELAMRALGLKTLPAREPGEDDA